MVKKFQTQEVKERPFLEIQKRDKTLFYAPLIKTELLEF